MFFCFPPPDPRLRPTHEVIQDGADAIEQNISHVCQTCESWILQNPGFWSRTSGFNLDLKKNKGPVGQGIYIYTHLVTAFARSKTCFQGTLAPDNAWRTIPWQGAEFVLIITNHSSCDSSWLIDWSWTSYPGYHWFCLEKSSRIRHLGPRSLLPGLLLAVSTLSEHCGIV